MAKADKYHVYVVGGGYEYIHMLYHMGFKGAKGIGDADFILFTGGEDVDPSLYDEKPLVHTRCNPKRDQREKAIFEEALKANLPMVGICRGGQFLNVMSGGKMWQHVNNHCGNHVMTVHDEAKPRTVTVTSTHHQMMIPGDGAKVLATACQSTKKERFNHSWEAKKDKVDNETDTEVVWYPKTQTLCFQPHPEFDNAPDDCRLYFQELLNEFIIPICDGGVEEGE